MRDDTNQGRSLVLLQEGGAAPPLFLVHDGDGETRLYHALARRLAGPRSIYGLHPERAGDVPIVHTTIEQMAAHYVAEIRSVRTHGPYLLGGLCAGGVVAFEMACQLEEAGEEARLVAVFDAADVDAERKPHLTSRRRLDRLFGAVRGASPWRIPGLVLARCRGLVAYELASRLRRRADRVAVATLRLCLARGLPLPPWARGVPVRTVYIAAEAEYRPRHVVRQEIALYRATAGAGPDEPFVAIYVDPLFGWARRTAKGVRACDIPGGHSTMFEEPNVAAMAHALGNHLATVASAAAEPRGQALAAASDGAGGPR
jgi:thioesterase domain-containing protein